MPVLASAARARHAGADTRRITTVAVSGARHHDESNIRLSLSPLAEGAPLALAALARGMQLARENPSKVPERAAAGEAGTQASVESWSRRLDGADLRSGGFVDPGTVRRRQPAAGINAEANGASIGALLHDQLHGEVAPSMHAAHVLRGADAAGRSSGSVGATLVVRC